MRNMSFAMTTPQIQARSKTVTRRMGWAFLRPGDLLQPVNKVMGFKPGEKPVPISGPIRVIDVRREPLNAITAEDVALEGFGTMSPFEFVTMLQQHYRCFSDTWVTRIEFEYVNDVKAVA